MSFDTPSERQRSWFFPKPWASLPFPTGEIDEDQRAAIWGSFYQGLHAGHSPLYYPDITVRTLALMIEEFKRSLKLRAVVSIFADQAQSVENVADDLIMKRLIDTAEGVQLDKIGEIVGESRLGRSDSDYRTAIIFRTFINNSNGEPETLLTVLGTLTAATQTRIIETEPAHAILFTNGSIIPTNLVSQMEQVAPAAVGLTVIAGYGETLFEFASEGGIPYNEGDGFSEYNYTEGGQPVGGKFAELIS